MREVLEHHKTDIEESKVMDKEGLTAHSYILLSTHREENVDSPSNFNDLLESLDAITEIFKKQIIISTHPRTRKKLETTGYTTSNPLVTFMKPFGFADYIKLQMNSFCVLSDSGTITEESSILGFPAVTIRQAHERPEGMDEGTLIMSGLKKDSIIDAIKVVTSQRTIGKWQPEMVEDYQTLNVSSKVLRIILSYIAYINRTVWFKQNNSWDC
jgi:UDP-N-acetylglucosamine 2-epimerase (non-hydrolysing)